MRAAIPAALLALGVAGSPASAAAAPPWRDAEPGHRWSFPRDHHSHPAYRNEWWYFTGLVSSDDGRRFGFQLTFFRVGVLADPPPLASDFAAGAAVMVHLAVTDLASGEHRFSEVLWRAAPLLGGFGAPGEPLIAWAQAPPGTEGRLTLALRDAGFVFSARDDARGIGLELAVRPERPLVLQGPNGWSRKAAAAGYASLYYSFTRLATEGTLAVGGRPLRVRGTSWMDHELGSSQLAPEQVGWDWWSLRLADGRDLMLYVLRRKDGAADFRTATLVRSGGEVVLLDPGAWSVEAHGAWKSPVTGATYPLGWTVSLPGEGIRLEVEPEVRACENVSAVAAGIFYWEGPVRVRTADGRAAGEGYVELTGYGEKNRPPL